MSDEADRSALDEIIAEQHPECADEDWPTISAEAIALMSLADCDEQLRRSRAEPLRLAQAAKSAHLAIQAGLTAALAGGIGIGAYDEKLERKWLAFLSEGGEPPPSRRVMNFDGLLAKAMTAKIGWGEPLQLPEGLTEKLEKLVAIRDGIEHPKPGFWVIEPAFIHRLLPGAARLALELIERVGHHFEPGEVEQAQVLVERICRFCDGIRGQLTAPSSQEGR